jgi:putative membrane protein
MRTILGLFKRDLKRIAKNPVALFISISLCFIPAIYAWFNIAANWNPYANTSGVTVMVANEDTGADVEGLGRMDLGKQVVNTLKTNHQLDWQFADKDEALEKVQSGEAYAAIVIPADFSKELTSIVTGKIELPQIDYYMNEKLNPIAGKVTDTGASTIENTINTEFVSTVATVVTDALKSTAADVSADTNSSTITALAHLQNARDTLEELMGSVDSTKETAENAVGDIEAAKGELGELDDVIADASQDISDAIQALEDTKADVDKLSTELSAELVKTANTLSSLSSKANGSIGQATSSLAKTQAALAQAEGALQSAHDTARTAYDNLSAAASTLPEGAARDQVEAAMSDLKTELDKTQSVLDAASSTKDKVDQAISDLDDDSDALNQGIQDASADLTKAAEALTTTVTPAIDSAINSLTSILEDLRSSVDSMPALVSQAQGTLDQLATTLTQAANALTATNATISNISTVLESVTTDVSAVKSGETYQALEDLIDVNTQDVADLISTPVTIVDKTIFPVENYGSGVAPFYTNLAIFVGGLMLCTLYRMSVDNEGFPEAKPWQMYVSRLLLLTPLAICQAIVTCVGDLVMGIQCVSPAAFIFAGCVGAIVYLNIIYALTVAFKHIGKALCVVIVILQIPGSSGLYPIEMQPEFFQAIYPWLPFTYGNNAMREAIAGFYDGYYAYNLAMLLLFIVPALLIGIGLRRYIVNIDSMFDRELKETDLFVADKPTVAKTSFGITTLIAAAMDNPEYHEEFVARAERFETKYPKLVRGGFIAMAVITPLDLVLALVFDSKLGILLAWVIAVVAICIYLIVVEFVHTKMRTRAELATTPHDQVVGMLGERLDRSFKPRKKKAVAAPGGDAPKGGDE